MSDQERAVGAALDRLMQAFRSGDDDAYFESFHPQASFMFHGQPRLEGRGAYRETWAGWKRDHGFRVLDSASHHALVQVFEGTAVVTHSVRTRQVWDGDEIQLRERESIVFVRDDEGRWLAVHEHLSEDDTGS